MALQLLNKVFVRIHRLFVQFISMFHSLEATTEYGTKKKIQIVVARLDFVSKHLCFQLTCQKLKMHFDCLACMLVYKCLCLW